MTSLKKWSLPLCLLGTLIMSLTTVQAQMIGTDELLHEQEKVTSANVLERAAVMTQLIDHGVDPVTARARVDQMTDEEVSQLNGQIAELPAGAGIGLVELLLIIILVILLV